jgi:Na+/pantothenate symporter
MLVGIVAVIASVLAGQGGFSEALTALSKIEDAKVSAQSGVFTSFFGPDPLGLTAGCSFNLLGHLGPASDGA